jgi:hypothetical protein
MIAKDAFISYPDHKKPFQLYCDASELQLGAVIIQNGRAVGFYSHKLTKTQRKYTVGEKEMLSIVETLKEFCTMLVYGCSELHIHTDHKNLIYNPLANQSVTPWRLFLKEYTPIFHCIKGAQNTLADALSRLPSCSERHRVPITCIHRINIVLYNQLRQLISRVRLVATFQWPLMMTIYLIVLYIYQPLLVWILLSITNPPNWPSLLLVNHNAMFDKCWHPTEWFIVIYQSPELLGKSIFLTNCSKILSDTIILCSVLLVLFDYMTQFPCIFIIAP